MDIAVRDQAYTGKNKYKLNTINRCRLYQQAIYIGDLMGVDKKTIHPGFLDGTMQHQHNAIKFPPTRKPTFLAWREWKAFIFRNFLRFSI